MRYLIWVAVTLAVILPIALAATSPLLQWRQPIYIVAGFSGIVGMTFLLTQPLLAGRYILGSRPKLARHLHRIGGLLLLVSVILHVAGLWLTSPPDVIDAFLFRSPTPFAPWGVIAMVAVLLSPAYAVTRRKVSPLIWRRVHLSLGIIMAVGTIGHVLLIEGTMEPISKAVLCVLVALAIAKLVYDQAMSGKI